MGFLSNLLKNEAKKLVSDVLDDKVKNVTSGKSSGNQPEMNNEMSKKGLQSRMERVFQTEFAGYEIRKNVSAFDVFGDSEACNYTYGMYLNGSPKAMIIILNDKNAYRKKSVRLAHTACENYGIPCFNFMSYLPSTYDYIKERLHESLG